MSRFRLAIALAAVCLAPVAHAQNFAFNPHFDTGVQSWTSNATIAWHDLDALHSPASGSLQLTFTSAYPNREASATQCVPVIPEAFYNLGVKIMVPGAQAATAAANVDFFASADCSGPSILSADTGQTWGSRNGAFSPVATGVRQPRDARSAKISLTVWALEAGTATASFDDVLLVPAGYVCVPDAFTLCLANARFIVGTTYTLDGVHSEKGKAVQLTADSGYFWFFDPNNVELIVKVLDGTGVNNHYWVFAAGTTNVGVTLTVYNPETMGMQTYTNPANKRFESILDTSAFEAMREVR